MPIMITIYYTTESDFKESITVEMSDRESTYTYLLENGYEIIGES